MARFFRRFFHGLFRKGNTILLALCFFVGFSFGCICAVYSGTDLSLMHSIPEHVVSIVWQMIFLALPFLFSVYAVYISIPELLYLICFVKAFLFAFVSFWLSCFFGNAGWLFRILFMFSDCLAMPGLYFFWHRHLSGAPKLRIPDAILVFLQIIVLGCLDYFLIFPFAHGLLLQKG